MLNRDKDKELIIYRSTGLLTVRIQAVVMRVLMEFVNNLVSFNKKKSTY